MRMNQIRGSFAAMLLATTAVAQESKPKAAGLTWFTDLTKAQVQAKMEKKLVLLFFHGSDWCPPCVQMQRHVIDSPEFAQFARQSLVLVNVDFPEKAKQSQELRRANLALKTRFNLSPEWGEGYPTLVLLNEAGETVFQETGYAGGGPAALIPMLKRHTTSTVAETAPAGFKNLTVEEFATLAADKTNIILDVRTREEFQGGHLLGAVNLDFNAADFEAKAATLDKSKNYLVHCAVGGRSAKASELLAKLGFPKVYNLPGGFRAWTKAGKPVEK